MREGRAEGAQPAQPARREGPELDLKARARRPWQNPLFLWAAPYLGSESPFTGSGFRDPRGWFTFQKRPRGAWPGLVGLGILPACPGSFGHLVPS